MKLSSFQGSVAMTLCLMIAETFGLQCYYCNGMDPHCAKYSQQQCLPKFVCYKITLSVQRGCTLLEEYCEHYIDRIGPLILSCRTCHDDFCNGSDRMQSFFWLCIVGVVSRSLL